MTPPKTPPATDHVCTQEEKIDELTTNFDKLEDTINGPEGLVTKVNALVNLVTPMAGDVKTVPEFNLKTVTASLSSCNKKREGMSLSFALLKIT